MPVETEKLERFHREVKECCKEGEYNLFLHKHLGDIFYAVALKEEFERRKGKVLHFIVRPGHAFLLDMWGVKDYSTYDVRWIEQEALDASYPFLPEADPGSSFRFDMISKDVFLSTPVLGEPFIIEGDQLQFLLFENYWCRQWACSLLGSVDFQYPIPRGKVSLSEGAQQVLRHLAPFDKIIMIAPDATTAIEVPPEIWDTLAEYFHSKGYTVVVNSGRHRIKHGISTFELGLSLKDVIALGQRCAYVFSLRSGLCDVLVGIGARLYAIYPAQIRREFGSLIKPFSGSTDVNEVQFYRWKTSPLIWEREDLTPLVQEQINLLRANYRREQLMGRFSREEERAGHFFWRGVFRNVAGESYQYPENNKENPPPGEMKVRLKLPRLTLYGHETDEGDGTERRTILGGVWSENRVGKCKEISVCGLRVYSRDGQRKKLLGITLQKYNLEERWLRILAQRVGDEYDDVYLLRHDIGETYVELVHLEERARIHGSEHPLVVVGEKKYKDVCRMILPGRIAVQHISPEQGDILQMFQERGEKQREIVREAEGHRFFCSTPHIAEHMLVLMKKKRNVNFYRYICESTGVCPSTTRLPAPRVSVRDMAYAARLRESEGLEEGKYVVFLPEEKLMKMLDASFWQTLSARFAQRGYRVYVHRTFTDGAELSVGALLEVCKHAAGCVSMGCGIAVLLTAAGCQLDIIYTQLRLSDGGKCEDVGKMMYLYSVYHLPGIDGQPVREYDGSRWELGKLTEQILEHYRVL